MKYIIESNDVIGYTPKYAMLFGDGYMIQPLEDLEELTADYINEHFSDLQDTAYQKGFEDGKAVNDKRCVGCKWEGNGSDHSPCDYCCNCYSSQWTAKDDKFEFGDEIIDSNGVKGCVISMNNEKSNTMYALFNGYKTPQCITKRNYRKTGKHYDVDDIKKLLEEMRHD